MILLLVRRTATSSVTTALIHGHSQRRMRWIGIGIEGPDDAEMFELDYICAETSQHRCLTALSRRIRRALAGYKRLSSNGRCHIKVMAVVSGPEGEM